MHIQLNRFVWILILIKNKPLAFIPFNQLETCEKWCHAIK